MGGCVDIYPVKREPESVPFEPDKINAMLGTDISPEEMIRYFELAADQGNANAQFNLGFQ